MVYLPHTRRSRITVLLVISGVWTSLLLAAGSVAAPAAHAGALVPVTITITEITQLGTDIDPGLLEGPVGDFYAGVTIDGTAVYNFDSRYDFPLDVNVGYVFPFTLSPTSNWTFSRNVDSDKGSVPVTIDLFDQDGCSRPGPVQFSPTPPPPPSGEFWCPNHFAGFNTGADGTVTYFYQDDLAGGLDDQVEAISLTVDLPTGQWSGDVNPPQSCVQGTGGGAVKVCFAVTTLSASGDLDGDGLLDSWETNGFNDDVDTTLDVDLPAMGANPRHQDQFLELDYQAGQAPRRADIQAMKAAFAAAPLNAGSMAGTRNADNGGPGVSAPPNPDGTRGIALHVDTGSLVDNTAREGQASGTCQDGIDNGRDGTIDGADPDCTFLDASVEDPGVTNCADAIDNDGDGKKDAADTDCLVGDNLGGGNTIAAPNACGLDPKFFAAKNSPTGLNADRHLIFRYGISAQLPGTCKDPTGGQGEIGGNDFIEFNHDGGTVMHELGHTLNLRHGGFEDDNCKPNYISVMNYDNQGGINRVGGQRILDYSPPRIALNGTTRGSAPLGKLVENQLNENQVLDASDNKNRFVFVNTLGVKVLPVGLNSQPNWNGDTDPPLETTVTANIDTVGTNGGPPKCENSTFNSTLVGADDWTFVSLPFRQFGDSANSALNVEEQPIPTLADLQLLTQELNTTDLAITVLGAPDPVAAGNDLVYTVTVGNRGVNPASSVKLVDTLPPDLTYVTSSGECIANANIVSCSMGELQSGSNRTITITAHVSADVVYKNGAPKTITNAVTVSNIAGPDPNPANDTDVSATKVVAVADLKVASLQAVTPPAQLLVAQTAPVSLRSMFTNSGPSAPMNATAVLNASASPGVSVTPSSAIVLTPALANGEIRTNETTFTIGCTQPGGGTVTFTSQIAPANAADSDPVTNNNGKTAVLNVDCVVPVAFNIKPGSTENKVKVGSENTPTAVLTTSAGQYGLPTAFDATKIVANSVRFGQRDLVWNGVGGSTEIHTKAHLEDSYELNETTRDGDTDAVLHFGWAGSGLGASDTTACVRGEIVNGSNRLRFFGCDSIHIDP